jgi:uncharacterized membrane protein (DUF485 family)
MSAPERISSQRRFNTRLGIILFFVYSLLYLGFVLINAFNPVMMETIVLAGLNLAIVYGFFLIAAAVVLALFYGFLCRNEPVEDSSAKGESK